MMIWRRHLRPRDLFVDVGANVGIYTIWAADLGARVIALEPASDTFQLLAENVQLNQYDVDLYRAAAGAEAGRRRFTTGKDCLNRLDPNGATEVQVLTLDDLFGDREVAGMKVDVEGFELDVLRGCHRALKEHRIHMLQLEWNECGDRSGVAELLAGCGYRMYRPGSEAQLMEITAPDPGPDIFATHFECPITVPRS